MKKTTAFIILLSALAPLFANTVSLRNFRYEANLGALRPKTLYKVHLTEALLKKASVLGNDIRIFDKNGVEVPYVIITDRIGYESPSETRLEIIDYNQDTHTLIAKFPDRAETVNTISLAISDSDFRRQVVIHGSNDMRSWNHIKQGVIYDYTSQIDLRSTSIRFPLCRYRYFRVSLHGSTNAGKKMIRLTYGNLTFDVDENGAREIRIDGVSAQKLPVQNGVQAYDRSVFETPAMKTENGDSIITLEARLPFDKITFDVANPYYHRRIFSYGGDTKKAESFLTEGSIFYFPGLAPDDRRDAIVCSAEKHAFYRFKIINGDSPALSIRRIILERFPRYCFFMSLNEGDYRLCTGNNAISAPQYDLSNFINEENYRSHKSTDIAIKEIRERRDYSPALSVEMKGKIEQWILTAVAIALSVILAFWIYRLVKKMNS